MPGLLDQVYLLEMCSVYPQWVPMGIVGLAGMALVVPVSLQPVSLHILDTQQGFTIRAHLSTNYPTFLTPLRILRKSRVPVYLNSV
jgi:hypothetical protein